MLYRYIETGRPVYCRVACFECLKEQITRREVLSMFTVADGACRLHSWNLFSEMLRFFSMSMVSMHRG